MDELLATLNDYRDRLNEADDWDLHDEGSWEEYARPGGCMYGSLYETRAYLTELEVRVKAL